MRISATKKKINVVGKLRERKKVLDCVCGQVSSGIRTQDRLQATITLTTVLTKYPHDLASMSGCQLSVFKCLHSTLQ